ncbi:MAG: hypothetical protein HND58_08975 [Planctomycetota bacterium]|nr:MAG: hypothetical protein HND58_08975 [Planctomycetota bacterium]
MSMGWAPVGVVDDAQAAVDEGDVDGGAVGAGGALAEAALAVGAAVLDGVVEDVEPGLGDGVEVGGRGLAGLPGTQDAGDAAHGGEGS